MEKKSILNKLMAIFSNTNNNNNVNNNNNMEKIYMGSSICAMAFGKVSESTEGSGEIKRYIGVGSSYILGVNPSKEELEKIYERSIENAPEYTGTQESNGSQVPYIRLDFITAVDPEVTNGINMKSKLVFFLRKEARYNRDRSKVQVIDKYGRTCWVGVEDAKNHVIPQYSNGPANIDKDYRPAYVGEEDLTNFLKAFLCIDNVMDYKNGTWVMKKNPSDYECRLEHIADYFSGNVKEIKDAIAMMPKNKVKLLYGVRTTDEGKQYQAIYTQMVLRNGSNNFDRLAKDVNERKEAGSYPTTEFEICELKEYNVEASNLSQQPTNEDPFAAQGDASDNPWNM